MEIMSKNDELGECCAPVLHSYLTFAERVQTPAANASTGVRDYLSRDLYDPFRYCKILDVQAYTLLLAIELQEAVETYKAKTDSYLRRLEEAEIAKAKASRAEAFGMNQIPIV
jgi:hypothetical protein